MHEKSLISVIVPMYNSENYVQRAIECLLAQTLSNIEIVLIDDSSTDNTASIAREYAKKYKNIKFLQNKRNYGSGYSKNRGVDASTSDIIGFLDVDDYVDIHYFENMYVAMKKYHADIVCSDIALVYTEHIVFSDLLTGNPYLNQNHIDMPETTEPIEISAEIASAHWGASSAPTKLMYKELSEPFWEGICDDIPRTFTQLAKAKKIVYVPNNYYFYVQRENSLEHLAFSETRLGLGDTLTELQNRLSKVNGHDDISKLVFAFSSWRLILNILNQSAPNKQREYLEKYYIKLHLERPDIKLLLQDNSYLDYYLHSQTNWGERRYIATLIQQFVEHSFESMIELHKKYGAAPEKYLPKVSIIIPVYNGSNYLEEAISSALAQDYSNFEVIVINDGSDDNGKTEKIAASFGDRIRYFEKQNGGVASALNYGISKMTGEYFSWLSHDDKYKTNKISREIEALMSLPDPTTAVICGYDVINAKGEYLYTVDPTQQYSQEKLQRPLFAVLHGCIHGCAVLMHKSYFEVAGIFDETLRTTQDYDLWFRTLRGKKICFLGEALIQSRIHEEQDSKKLNDIHMKECTQLWIHMLKNVSDKDIIAITDPGTADIKTSFLLSEKKFFEQTPYKQVLDYIDTLLLKEGKKRWIEDHTFTYLNSICKLDIGFCYLDGFLTCMKEMEEKTGIAFISDNFVDASSEKSLQSLSARLQSIPFEIIFLDQEVFHFTKCGKITALYLPLRIYSSLPELLFLLNINLCIFSDKATSFLWAESSVLRRKGIGVVAWNTIPYFDFYYQESSKSSQLLRIMLLRNANIIVWEDEESCKNSGYQHKSFYIQSLLKSEKSSDYNIKVQKLLNKPLENNKDYEIHETDDIGVRECLLLYENMLLTLSPDTKLDTWIPIKQVVHVENCVNANKWENAYKAVLSSTSWKLTAPLRKLTDRIKKI